jgi:predicted acylesterase/phospholipase RssA
MSTRPLQALIARHITPALLDRIAAQHRRGRRLLVMTTNLDAERGVIWDMGAIAASGASDRLSLFRQVLLASASIPGVFPGAHPFRCAWSPLCGNACRWGHG